MDWFLRRTTNSLLLCIRSSLTWRISPTCAHPRLESVFLDESHDRNQEFLCGLSSYCTTEMHPDDLLTCLHMTQPHAWLSNYLTQLQLSPVCAHERCKGERQKSNASRITQEFPSERGILKSLCLVCKVSARKSKKCTASQRMHRSAFSVASREISSHSASNFHFPPSS